MILRARTVVPVCRPPVEDGVVVVAAGRVLAAGRWADWRAHVTGEPEDLGEVVLLPGLVNAHCHLDYTDMAGSLPPVRSFTDWITGILALKAQWSYTEFARSWLNGARMQLRHGTTTVADVEAVPELLPDVWGATPLRVISFLEMTGVRASREPEAILLEALARVEALPQGRCVARLSPHAPYSTPPGLLVLAGAVSEERGWPVTTHVSESDEEFAMFANAQGPMYEWLRKNGRDMSDCGTGSPVSRLEALGYLSHRLVGVHLNYLAAGDAGILHRHQVQVVHCPRSHRYFQHRRFPFDELEREGVNVALGTDSLATVRCYRNYPVELDMFAEMRTFAADHPQVSPRRILAMATQHGARALGFGEDLGRIAEGTIADLVAIPVSAPVEAVEEAVVQYRGEVVGSMIEGRWAITPPGID